MHNNIHADHSSSESIYWNSNTTQQETSSPESKSLADRCLELWQQAKSTWIAIPTQTKLSAGEQPTQALSTGTINPEAGGFVMHINVDPTHMSRAIPIVLKILHQHGAPEVDVHFQTKQYTEQSHYIGNEFGLVFSKTAEQQEGTTHAIQGVLTNIQQAFKQQGISPEKGTVLTTATRRLIRGLPTGWHSLEKENLEKGVYERKVPGSSYFSYRYLNWESIPDNSELVTLMSEDERKEAGMLIRSEVKINAIENPENAHNPLGVDDPFANLHINI